MSRSPDLVTPKLPALLQYQVSLPAPAAPAGSFDPAAASRGQAVFTMAGCASCHSGAAFTDVGNGPDPSTPTLHDASETGMNPQYASRSATGKYRTAPLKGAWQHAPYFHDGSAATLEQVVEHYDRVRSLGLTAAQKADLAAYLKSL